MNRDRIIDRYSIQARLVPVLIVTLPVGLFVVACFPDDLAGWSLVWGIISWCGGTILLAQLGRDMGARKENSLFELWGGKPTTRILRHSNSANPITLARRHKAITTLLDSVTLPTPEEEKHNPDRADQIYDAAVTILRERTRDRNKFELIFQENSSYGFRRNLWGMKPIGLAASVGAFFGICVCVVLGRAVIGEEGIVFSALLGGLVLVLALVCALVITPDWVRISANAYAERLLEACERL